MNSFPGNYRFGRITQANLQLVHLYTANQGSKMQHKLFLLYQNSPRVCNELSLSMAIRNKPARLRISPSAAVNSTTAITTERSYTERHNIHQSQGKNCSLGCSLQTWESSTMSSLKYKLLKNMSEIGGQVNTDV